jgi:hypothetical protein
MRPNYHSERQGRLNLSGVRAGPGEREYNKDAGESWQPSVSRTPSKSSKSRTESSVVCAASPPSTTPLWFRSWGGAEDAVHSGY